MDLTNWDTRQGNGRIKKMEKIDRERMVEDSSPATPTGTKKMAKIWPGHIAKPHSPKQHSVLQSSA
jgi:hypothetical protein